MYIRRLVLQVWGMMVIHQYTYSPTAVALAYLFNSLRSDTLFAQVRVSVKELTVFFSSLAYCVYLVLDARYYV